MERHDQNLESATRIVSNPGYALFQLAKALTTSEECGDHGTRERAQAKIEKWVSVLRNVLTGSADYGSRTPVGGLPTWATLEVVTGGFATGGLLAGGPLQAHEIALLENLPKNGDEPERRLINGHFLTDDGLATLRERLQTNCYDFGVPEEGALLVVAWLAEHGYTEDARALLDTIVPWFATLRFYPVPLQRPRRFGAQVHLQDVRQTIAAIERIKPNRRILAQKEAVEVWAPLYDRLVALFLETVVDDWPCRTYPEGWSRRAETFLGEYAGLRGSHSLCGKPDKAGGYFSQLRQYLAKVARRPDELTGREVGRIRLILRRYFEKRGLPDSESCAKARSRQRDHVGAPLFHDLAKVVAARLATHAQDEGIDDIGPIQRPVDSEESRRLSIPAGSPMPEPVQRKVQRCLNETVAELVARGLITSGESLARILPRMTSGLRAAGIVDPSLRHLYSAIYRAFRRRRSLLLLNLEKQVQIEELPWVAAIERFRREDLSGQELAGQALEEVSVLAISSFPHAILPNKLLQELRALAATAGREIPLVEEVAADIFMGRFSGKFIESAKLAADQLEGSLYARYYGIDYEEVRRLRTPPKPVARRWLARPKPDGFAELCASRAGVALGTWNPAINGMIIEQQQIVTTQNLAALFVDLALADALRGQLSDMAARCYRWICERQQMKIDRGHARMIMVKNAAYAWRQMIFFLALLPQAEVDDFLGWAGEHLRAQRPDFAARFRPALQGLLLAADGQLLDDLPPQTSGAKRFLGWTNRRHWLLTDS